MPKREWTELSPDLARMALVRYPGHYVEAGDSLRVNLFSAVASATVIVSGRTVDLDGRLHTFAQSLVIAATGAQTVAYVPVDTGFLVDLEVSTPTAALAVGDIIAVVDLVQSRGTTVTPLAPLVAGYVATYQPIGLDDVVTSAPIGSVSRVVSVEPANPAAGADLTVTVPAGQQWELLAVKLNLATSSAVGTRQVFLNVDTPTQDPIIIYAVATQILSLNFNYLFSQMQRAAFTLTTYHYEQFGAGIVIPPTGDLYISWDALDVGDQLSSVALLVRRTLLGG